MNIICSNCNKDSGIEQSDSQGVDAARVQDHLNWIPKNDFLFEKGKGNWYYYCSKECKDDHWKQIVDKISTKEDRENVKKLIDKSKERFKENLPRLR